MVGVMVGVKFLFLMVNIVGGVGVECGVVVEGSSKILFFVVGVFSFVYIEYKMLECGIFFLWVEGLGFIIVGMLCRC